MGLKIKIESGCADYLLEEIDQLRKDNELLRAKCSVMDNFFSLVNRLGDSHRVGYSEDRLYQAKKEIESARKEAVEPKQQKETDL